jgi:hypothetical protein
MEKVLKSINDEMTIRYYLHNAQTLVSKGILDLYPERHKRIKSMDPAGRSLFVLCLHLPYLLKAMDAKIMYSEPSSSIDMKDDIHNARYLENTKFIYLNFYATSRCSQIEGEEYLEAASKILKQNPSHILRISLIEKRILNIQTNEILETKTVISILRLFYQLIQAQYANSNIEPVINLLNALAQEDMDAANEILISLLGAQVMKGYLLDTVLTIFEENDKRQINETYSSMQNCIDNMESLKKQYTDILKSYQILNERAQFYEANPQNTDTKIIKKYLSKTPYIKEVYKYDAQTLKFVYEAPMLYYSKTVVQKLRDTTLSDKKAEVYDIFLNDRFTMYTRCALLLDIYTFRLTQSYIGSSDELYGHPHIDNYGCFGNHIDAIRDWAERKDYLGVLEQMSAMVLNLNFTDSIVINSMVDIIHSDPDKPSFFDKETKEFISFNDITKILKEEKDGIPQTEKE